jgi:hypothetical protein
MSSHNVEKGSGCCALATPGVAVLTFPDGSRSAVVGLNKILAAVYTERRPVTAHTAKKILERLAASNPIDESVRQCGCDPLLEEYRKYTDTRVTADPTDSVAYSVPGQDLGLTEVLSKLLFKVLRPSHSWSSPDKHDGANRHSAGLLR